MFPHERYTFVRPVGSGGMGVVDLVYDAVRAELVARKRIRQATPEAYLRFKREFRIAEDLRHPNLVRLYDLGQDDEGLFFTMEHVEGVDFATFCLGGPASPQAQTLVLSKNPWESAQGVPSPVLVSPPPTEMPTLVDSELAGARDSFEVGPFRRGSRAPTTGVDGPEAVSGGDRGLGAVARISSSTMPGASPPSKGASLASEPLASSTGEPAGPSPLAHSIPWHTSAPPPSSVPPTRRTLESTSTLAAVLPGLLDALAFLHERGVVHCDLKPSNVLVRRDGIVKVLDFGIAALLEEPAQRSGFGTFGYMAPEQVIGAAVGPEADLYALGAMLFELFAGRLPVEGGILAQRARLLVPPPLLSELRADAPPALVSLVAALLSTAPSGRPTLDEVRAVCEASLSATKEERPTTERAPSGRAQPILGRDAELDELYASFRTVEQGGFAFIVLRGPTGAGKTTVARELARRARGWGARVLKGRARLREHVPFNGVDEAIDDLAMLLKERDPADSDPMRASARERAAAVFPVLAGAAISGGASTVTRAEAFAATIDLLRETASSNVLVCLLDDLQWASDDALALLEALLLGAPLRVLVVATMRPAADDGAEERFRRMLAMERVRVVDLPLLSPSVVRMLVTRHLEELHRASPPSEIDALVAACEGRPLLAELVARHCTGVDKPDPLQALERAVASCDRLERACLMVVLATGDWVPLGLLARAVSLPYPAVEDIARGLGERGFVRIDARGGEDRVDFYHDAVASAVGRLANASELARTHAALAAALELSVEPPLERVVRHLLGAGSYRAAAERAVAAGRRAERQKAYSMAADLYAVAVEHGVEWSRDVVEARARCLERAGRYAEAADAFGAVARVSTGDEALRARLDEAHALLASNQVARGRASLDACLRERGESLDRSRPAVLWGALRFALGPPLASRERRSAEKADPAALALADTDARLSAMAMYFEPLVGIAYTLRARRAFERLGAHEEAAFCHFIFGYFALFGTARGGPVPLAERYTKAALRELEHVPKPSAKLRMMIPSLSGIAAQREARWATARARFEEALAVLEDAGLGGTFEHTIACTHRVTTALTLGRVEEGRLTLRRFALASGHSDLSATRCHLEFLSCWLEVLEGRFDEAASRAEELVASWPEVPTFQKALVELARALAAPYRDADARAVRRLCAAAVREGKRFGLFETMYVGKWATMIALVEAAAIRQGDPEASLAYILELRYAAERSPPCNTMGVFRAEAYARDALGQDPRLAVALLARAEALALKYEQPIEAAIARYQRGLRLGGDEGAACRESAAALLAETGASPLLLEEGGRSRAGSPA